MKLLVTGVCGRLGRAIATEASAQGMTVVGLDIVGWPADVDLPANVHLNECSFEDLDRVARLLEGCDAMIHTAGPHGGFVETLDLPGFLEGNVVVAARLLEAGLKAGLKGVNLASTMEVLVGRNWDTSGAAFLDEDSPPPDRQRVQPESIARGAPGPRVFSPARSGDQLHPIFGFRLHARRRPRSAAAGPDDLTSISHEYTVRSVVFAR